MVVVTAVPPPPPPDGRKKGGIGVKHIDTHGVAKTQTEAPHMQVLVGHPSLATESDEAVPV